jgi:hypothetical protein
MKGPKNIVTDTLSCLEMTSDMESLDMAGCYGLDSNDLPDNVVSYTLLHHEQKKDKTLLKQAQTTTHAYSLKEFHGVVPPFTYCVSKTRLSCQQVK